MGPRRGRPHAAPACRSPLARDSAPHDTSATRHRASGTYDIAEASLTGTRAPRHGGKETAPVAVAQQKAPLTLFAAERRTKFRNYMAKTWPLYVMIMLPLVPLALFHYYPMYGVVIAFQNFNPGLGFSGSPWVGLENFKFIFSNPDFKNVLANSFIIAVSKIVTLQIVAVSLALMLNEVRTMLFKRTVQTVIYLPHFLSWIVLGGILIDMLSTTGMINRALGTLGIRAHPLPGQQRLVPAGGRDHQPVERGGLGHDHLPGGADRHRPGTA